MPYRIWLTGQPALRLISRNTLRDCYSLPTREFDGPGAKLPPYWAVVINCEG